MQVHLKRITAAGRSLFLLLVIQRPILAEVLQSNAEFDTDSYIYMGTNNQWAPFITLNPHWSEEHPNNNHFNFGMIRFSLSGIPAEGKKYISFSLDSFVNTISDHEFENSDSGESLVHLVALGAPIEQYFLPSVSKRAWYNLHVYGRPTIGIFNFISTDGDGMGRYYLDITDTVNNWLENPSTHFGFGLWAKSGSVELVSANNPNSDLRPQLVSAIPLDYITWLRSYFDENQLDDPYVTAWEADPDEDGIPNGLEYHAGLHPLQNSSFWSVGVSSGQAVMSCPLRSGLATGSAEIQISPDGTNWQELSTHEGISVHRSADALSITFAAPQTHLIRIAAFR